MICYSSKFVYVTECSWAGTDLFMDSCNSTAQKDKATGKKGAATELELGTYALSQSFSHVSHQSQSIIFIPKCAPLSLLTPHHTQYHIWGTGLKRALDSSTTMTGIRGRLGMKDVGGSCGWNSMIESRSRVRARSLLLFPLSLCPSELWSYNYPWTSLFMSTSLV